VQKEYLRSMTNMATIHAMCEDYRASASIDLKWDELDEKKKITVPLRVLWAEKGPMGRLYDVLGIWKTHGTKVTGRALPGGHNLQEDVPDDVFAEIQGLLKLYQAADSGSIPRSLLSQFVGELQPGHFSERHVRAASQGEAFVLEHQVHRHRVLPVRGAARGRRARRADDRGRVQFVTHNRRGDDRGPFLAPEEGLERAADLAVGDLDGESHRLVGTRPRRRVRDRPRLCAHPHSGKPRRGRRLRLSRRREAQNNQRRFWHT
jgi:hypothetical protein